MFMKKKNIDMKNKTDMSFNISSFINQKSGKITDDYIIMNPPLGKGFFILLHEIQKNSRGFRRSTKSST